MISYSEEAIRSSVVLDKQSIACIETSFTWLYERKAVVPPIMQLDIPEQNGEVDIKSAYIQGEKSFAIKLSSGFFNNPNRGLPSLSGLMVVLNSETGIPETLLLDNGYLTDLRTAAAGAVAAKYLAKKHIDTVCVIGTGTQARLQIMALYNQRPFKNLLVYGRTRQHQEAYAAVMHSLLPINIKLVDSAREAVLSADVLITTTSAKQPLVQKAWLHPGLHITAMGSDTEAKQELEADVVTQADVIVCDLVTQCSRFGELHHAIEQKKIDSHDSRIHELCELTSGHFVGRQNDQEITLCDLTGVGVQDTAIACFAQERLSGCKK